MPADGRRRGGPDVRGAVSPRLADEHVRFAVYLDKLQQVADANEADLVSRVLADPERTMAQSAVLRYLGHRATDLYLGPAYSGWVQTMTQATIDHPFLTWRLREWPLFRAVTLKLPWQPDNLPASSNWLQLKTAAGTNAKAGEILAEAGRTKRIRQTARASLTHRSES